MVQNEISYLIQLSYKPCNPNIVCYYVIRFWNSIVELIYHGIKRTRTMNYT